MYVFMFRKEGEPLPMTWLPYKSSVFGLCMNFHLAVLHVSHAATWGAKNSLVKWQIWAN